MIDPLPAALMWRNAARQHRYTDVRLTSCTLCHACNPVLSIRSSSGGEMPALLKAMSTDPQLCAALSNNALTADSSVTSTRTNSPPRSSATDSPAARSMSPTKMVAPSARIRRAAARPIPLAPPVITATLPASRWVRSIVIRVPGASSLLGRFDREQDVLDFGEAHRCVRPEFTAEPRLLEATERRVVAHRGVRIDGQVTGFDRPDHSHRPRQVVGPDRSRQSIGRIVRQRDPIGFVVEWQHRDHRSEDLFPDG